MDGAPPRMPSTSHVTPVVVVPVTVAVNCCLPLGWSEGFGGGTLTVTPSAAATEAMAPSARATAKPGTCRRESSPNAKWYSSWSGLQQLR
jgi:hypothetical protein